MAELNEQQLLLLNSLVYLDADFSGGRSMEEIVKDLQKPGALDSMDIGGGMTKEEAERMIGEIAADDALMALKIDSCVNTDIRGVCFVDPETEDAVIVFRGTGPAYAAWDDNCQGGYLADTDMQKEALAFAQNCAERYDDITVTGHSKGGNMAQYVTVLMGDEVDRCVSFDGQGFSDEFLIKYAKEISENQSKIRSVCAHNDYVNILLVPIAAETVYLANDGTGMEGHYVYKLYENEKNKLDDNGEYVSSEKQDTLMAGAKLLLNSWLLTKVDSSNPLMEYIFYSFAGMLMGLAVAEDGKSVEEILEELLDNANDFLESLTGLDIQKWITGLQDTSVSVGVNTQALRDYSTTMASAASEMEGMYSRIKSLQKKMSTNIVKGISIGLPLQTVLRQLESESIKLRKLANVLNECAGQYDAAEQTVKGIAG